MEARLYRHLYVLQLSCALLEKGPVEWGEKRSFRKKTKERGSEALYWERKKDDKKKIVSIIL